MQVMDYQPPRVTFVDTKEAFLLRTSMADRQAVMATDILAE